MDLNGFQKNLYGSANINMKGKQTSVEGLFSLVLDAHCHPSLLVETLLLQGNKLSAPTDYYGEL